ncbi:4-hydroxy-tetrahydrodipicolinate reductase [Iodidimonas gelatinilytica]|uniref:4-hydroxy-tetrahydrodipicolinate reductase n=1 Tax=Iodidimonas gelatinilytica TaxID=1236966 RepID=UPI0012314398
MRIGLLGISGRMGQALLKAVLDCPEAVLSGGVARPGSPDVGRALMALDGTPLDLCISDDASALFAQSDVVIDFTAPKASLTHARLAATHKTPLVVGSTGFDPDQQAAMDQATAYIALLQAANFSLGVNLLHSLVRQAAQALGPEFDIEILEMHHRHKADAPSGTALALGEAAASGRGIDLASHSDRVRDGITGPRTEGHIGFATLRGGDVAGEHAVLFAGAGERITLSHQASDRMVFARGAVKAALWLVGKKAGQYDMMDVLGLKA